MQYYKITTGPKKRLVLRNSCILSWLCTSGFLIVANQNIIRVKLKSESFASYNSGMLDFGLSLTNRSYFYCIIRWYKEIKFKRVLNCS